MKETITNRDALDYSSAFFNPSAWEKLNQPLFDTLIYPAKGSAQLSFFQIPVGQGTGKDGGPKSYGETNIILGGQLPTGQAFIIKTISLRLFLGGQDVRAERRFYNRAWFNFDIGSKMYQTGQAADLREGVTEPEISLVFEPEGAGVTVTAKTGEDWAPYKISPNNLLLIANQNFRLSVYDLPPIKTPARIRATLGGELLRLTA